MMKELISSRLKSIDALRGVASLAVVVFHASTALEVLPSNELWFRIVYAVPSHGHLGVALFFVISGFCIHLRWAKHYAQTGERRMDFGSFWKRRLFRLYPPYFVALCLTMGMVAVAYMVGVSVPLMGVYPEPRPQWMVADFVAHVFMLHGLHPTFDMAGGNGVYWTLAREEYFYIMYWVLLASRLVWGTKKSLVGVLTLGVVFPYAMSFVLPAQSEWWPIVNRSAIVLWIQWYLGFMAVEAYCGLVKLPRWCYWGWLVPVWFAAAVLSEHYAPRLEPILWGMSFFTLLNYCVQLERAGRWPQHALFGWFSKVGVFSYSLYLVHNPVRGMVKYALGSLAVTNTHARFWFTVVVLTVAGYYAGRIFFHLVERRFLTPKLTGASPVIFKNNPQMEVEAGS